MHLNHDQLLNMLRRMWAIRCFEQTVVDLFRRGAITGATHVSVGEEGTAVGACAALEKADYITSTHRGHGHCIAKGGELKPMMAELLGRADIDAVIDAARTANAHDFIAKKPDGYDTLVEEGGKNLSAGEKQRIAIARAVLCDPQILLLDEATASVDVETEKEIQEALERLTSKRTTISIAHRLSTLKKADRLLVLEKGKVAEIGTHKELMAKEDGIYNKMATLHAELSEIRAGAVDG